MKFSIFVKGFFSFLWETGLIVIAVYYILDFCNVGIDDITKHFDRRGQRYYSLNERIDLYIFRDRKYRLYDKAQGKFISKKYEMIGTAEPGDSLVVFKKGEDRYGYLNINTGEIVFPANLRFATDFSHGMAAIVPEKEERVHFVNSTFKDIFSETFYFNRFKSYKFNENGFCIIPDENGECLGVINSRGEWVIEPVYSDIERYFNVPYYEIITVTQKHGVLDSCFNWTVEPIYENLSQTEDYTGLYASDSSGQKLIDYQGNVIAPFIVGDTGDLTYSVSSRNNDGEYATVQIVSDRVCYFQIVCITGEYKYGLMDRHTGKVIIPAIYDDVNLVSEDIVKCSLDQYSYRLFDIKGKPINQTL